MIRSRKHNLYRIPSLLIFFILISGCALGTPATSQNLYGSTLPQPTSSPKYSNPVRSPPVTADIYNLEGIDAVLFNAAVNLKTYSGPSVCIPVVSIYDSYEKEDSTVYICDILVYLYYSTNLGDPDIYQKRGESRDIVAFTVQETLEGKYEIISTDISEDGESYYDSIVRKSGPLLNLPEQIVRGQAKSTSITSTTDFKELLKIYLDAYQDNEN